MVQVGPRQLEMRDIPLPAIGQEDGLLRVEGCGICGSDLDQFGGSLIETLGWKYSDFRYPVIPGHETVGVIEQIGANAAKRWGVALGDRVAVAPSLPCGVCRRCLEGRSRACEGHRRAYGMTSTDVSPSLWGGFSDYLYLPPGAEVFPMSKEVPSHLTTLFNPLAAGFQWASILPGTKQGDRVVIFGPGQRGLACLIAARQAGASFVAIVGASADKERLRVARALGADATLNVAEGNVVEKLKSLTEGKGADVIVDASSHSTEPVVQSLEIAAMGGTIVLAGIKGRRTVDGFISDTVVGKRLVMKGASGPTGEAVRAAIRLLEEKWQALAVLQTHAFPVTEAEKALRTLARESPDAESIHVTLHP